MTEEYDLIERERIEEIEELKKEINDLKAKNEELEAALKILKELYDKNIASKGHEYEVSNMVDRSLSFLEKKVERADNLLKNPHKIFFTKARNKKEVSM